MSREQVLLRVDEAFLYQVPPLKHAAGHKAEDWGLGSPTMTAKLELVGVDDVLYIRIVNEEKIVAVCPVRCAKGSPPIGAVVDSVVDSSRYFVLRCEDDQRRHAYVGVGFRERDMAYDFKASIQDFQRSVQREEEAVNLKPESDVDLALKGPIKINLGDSRPRRPVSNDTAPRVLAPPPSSLDDFGDFESAPYNL